MMTTPTYLPLSEFREYPVEEMTRRAEEFYESLRRRRTVRDFADRPVPREIIETCLKTAGTAPNGANQQPWHFTVIGKGPLRTEIRAAAEEEERAFYAGKAGTEWLHALEPLGTDANKPFLETAPWLIAIFGERYSVGENGEKVKNYYVPESVNIATGFLIAALHHAGLATLTHTPNPMNFLNKICKRPDNERPYILLVAGYPAEDATVPEHATHKKPLDEICSFL
ncbi:nitroreductase family protein [Aestuariispira ectoiniformans]|uniref:nitroreductase family protein n=1 Tax=Aestuariispira ectoiniformans TaxID=2775080 RepID=UPI00223ACBB6|nr:nitroreductase family protein [Aestuariispira ectoiniformans]